MSDKAAEIAVIASLPADVRTALSERFALADYPLEGPQAVPISTIPHHFHVVATRALLGVPPLLLDVLPHLKLVISMGAGLEKIDTDRLAQRNIEVVHTPDEFTEDVADFALGQIFAAQRDLVAADRFVRSGQWATSRFRTARRVTNRRVGIVGLGRIGRRIADKCAALGMAPAYHSRRRHDESDLTYFPSLGDLARWCDILVLACADTPETRNMVDKPVLDALGPEGILVNVARGSVVDEEALIAALEHQTIKAAALDVFVGEPRLDERFLRLENVLLSPHSASFTEEARAAVNMRLVSAASAYFARHSPG